MKIRTSVQVALIVGACTVLAPLYGPSIRARAATPQDDLDKSFKSIAAVLSLLEQNYADTVSSEKAIYQGAIPGMLRTLDPHSNFLDPTEYADMQRKQRAQYFGIGMLISMDGPKVIAMEPFPGSPAWRADLRRGDVIVAVDGKDVTKKDSAGVADMLRGNRGTPVRVTVMREGAAEPVTVTVIRGEIETSLVDAFWYKPGIAFLKVTSFEAQNVARDVEAALLKLDESKIQGLILDLRENRGGLVTEAVSLAGRFLHDGQVVVSHRGRAEKEQVFRAKANPLSPNYPIIVRVQRLLEVRERGHAHGEFGGQKLPEIASSDPYRLPPFAPLRVPQGFVNLGGVPIDVMVVVPVGVHADCQQHYEVDEYGRKPPQCLELY